MPQNTDKRKDPYIPVRVPKERYAEIEAECVRRFNIPRLEFVREAIEYFLPESRKIQGRDSVK